jgi:hypothetical protein
MKMSLKEKMLKNEKKIAGLKSHGLVSFDHLELPTDGAPAETFRDLPRALDDLPRALDDMPADVFDAIPRAVTAREEKRLEQVSLERGAGGGGTGGSSPGLPDFSL